MKTAEHWYDEYPFSGPNPDATVQDEINWLKKIQADAIRGAVNTISNSDIYDGDLRQLEPALKIAKHLEKK